MQKLTINLALNEIICILRNAGIEQPNREALLLISEAVCKDTSWIIAHKEYVLSLKEEAYLLEIAKRRELREPFSYIIGKSEFLGMEFLTGKGVLIPRPETETLVEIAAKHIENIKSQTKINDNKKLLILDIGTGSGCIAIGLACLCGGIEVVACDASDEALNYANANITSLGRLFKNESSVRAVKADLEDKNFHKIFSGKFKMIISNPPYIMTEDLKKTEPELSYEPRMALDGHSDGLYYYRIIASKAYDLLEDDGMAALEIGYNQMDNICNILRFKNRFIIKEALKDYSGNDRYIIAEKYSAASGENTD